MCVKRLHVSLYVYVCSCIPRMCDWGGGGYWAGMGRESGSHCGWGQSNGVQWTLWSKQASAGQRHCCHWWFGGEASQYCAFCKRSWQHLPMLPSICLSTPSRHAGKHVSQHFRSFEFSKAWVKIALDNKWWSCHSVASLCLLS